jgi:hypothetical protein
MISIQNVRSEMTKNLSSLVPFSVGNNKSLIIFRPENIE